MGRDQGCSHRSSLRSRCQRDDPAGPLALRSVGGAWRHCDSRCEPHSWRRHRARVGSVGLDLHLRSESCDGTLLRDWLGCKRGTEIGRLQRHFGRRCPVHHFGEQYHGDRKRLTCDADVSDRAGNYRHVDAGFPGEFVGIRRWCQLSQHHREQRYGNHQSAVGPGDLQLKLQPYQCHASGDIEVHGGSEQRCSQCHND